MNEKPEALRLAELLEKMPLGECDNQAAAELRRLAAVEDQRDALLELVVEMDRHEGAEGWSEDLRVKINAAIKLAEEGK